uniref:Uncharacterized protein n=1 Tax=Sphaerodactylus townsendi TaxID=933632 RepID=A0ACB8E6S1_9SAUR
MEWQAAAAGGRPDGKRALASEEEELSDIGESEGHQKQAALLLQCQWGEDGEGDGNLQDMEDLGVEEEVRSATPTTGKGQNSDQDGMGGWGVHRGRSRDRKVKRVGSRKSSGWKEPDGEPQSREALIRDRWQAQLDGDFREVESILLPNQPQQKDLLCFWGFLVSRLRLAAVPTGKLQPHRQAKLWQLLTDAREEERAKARAAKAVTMAAVERLLVARREIVEPGGGMCMDRAPPERYITTRQHVDYKPVMRKVTEEIGLSTIHGTAGESLEHFLDRYLEDHPPVEYWQSTGARPKIADRAMPIRESLEFTGSQPDGSAESMATMRERELGEPRCGSRLKLTFPNDLGTEEPEDPSDSSGDVAEEEPLGREVCGVQSGNQAEDLENIRWQLVQEWQRTHDSSPDVRLQQEARLPGELEREKETLYRQLQQDRDKQERELRLLAEQSRLELSREKLTLRALRDQGEVDAALQRAEQQWLLRDRQEIEQQQAALARRERELLDLEARFRQNAEPRRVIQTGGPAPLRSHPRLHGGRNNVLNQLRSQHPQ